MVFAAPDSLAFVLHAHSRASPPTRDAPSKNTPAFRLANASKVSTEIHACYSIMATSSATPTLPRAMRPKSLCSPISV